jgi:hypothetical protein
MKIGTDFCSSRKNFWRIYSFAILEESFQKINPKMYFKIAYCQTLKDWFQISPSLSKFIDNLVPVIKIIL